MMEKEFNLSKRVKTNDDWKPFSEFSFYWETDVKEFINKISNIIGNCENIDIEIKSMLLLDIESLAGDKLIGETG